MNRRNDRAIRCVKWLALGLSLTAVTGCSSTQTIRKDDADGGRTSTEKGPDGNGTAGTTTVSGARLKARSLTAEDGARHFVGWYDSEREEECRFQRASDGEIRCLPVSTGMMNTSWYSDATCTKPLVYAPKSCEAPKTASLQESFCATFPGSSVKILAIDGPFRGASFYTKSGKGCTSSPTATVTDTYDLFSVGKEIDPAAFVGATESTE